MTIYKLNSLTFFSIADFLCNFFESFLQSMSSIHFGTVNLAENLIGIALCRFLLPVLVLDHKQERQDTASYINVKSNILKNMFFPSFLLSFCGLVSFYLVFYKPFLTVVLELLSESINVIKIE